MKRLFFFAILGLYATSALAKVTVENLMPSSGSGARPTIKIISVELPDGVNCDRNTACSAGYIQFLVENVSNLQGLQDSIELEFFEQKCEVVRDGNGWEVVPRRKECFYSKTPETIILDCDRVKNNCYGSNPVLRYRMYWAEYPHDKPSMNARSYAHQIRLKHKDGSLIVFENGDASRIVRF